VTNDRIVEFQRAALVAQQNHLDAALLKLRQQSDELDLAHEHNRTLLALLDRSRRDTAVANSAAELLTQRLIRTRQELQDLRDTLADAPSITEPGGFAG
jgi:hypothetical protein